MKNIELTPALVACLAHLADVIFHADAPIESDCLTLVSAGLARRDGISFDITPKGTAALDSLVAEGKATRLVIAPFYADPYCGRKAYISCSLEAPCRLSGHEIFTGTGCMHIKDPSRLTTRIVPGRYDGPLWVG